MGSDSTARLYACPNIRTNVKNVEADRQTPGFMRAPPETPYMFALESAMDELSYALGIDPLELRRLNDTMIDPVAGIPYTSRSLLHCIDAGAEAFGWKDRNPQPGSMRDGDDLVGYGYATALYPAMIGPSDCRVTITPELQAIVEVGTHEIGTGIRTVIAQTAADILGIEVRAVEVRIGDSALPAAPLSAGSNSTASVCNVVAKACTDLRGRFEPGSRPRKRLVANATNTPHGTPSAIGPALIRRGNVIMKGGSMLKDRLQFSFGAQFVEVRINRWTGQISVPRVVGAFAAGRIINPKTARSQLTGGQLWGISAALYESADLDGRVGRYVNDNLSEYHIPVNADVVNITTLILPEQDTLINPLGIKGVGELGTTGMNAAVANAVYHATGLRCRKLPIRVDHLLSALD
jgi:xanthine dehydrogenase YagR molybdenum-binding subunit